MLWNDQLSTANKKKFHVA